MRDLKGRLLWCIGLLVISLAGITVQADGNTATGEEGNGVGVAYYVNPSDTQLHSNIEQAKKDRQKKEEEKKEASTLVMANVNNTLNVRAEADETSEKVGYLYKDCGGTILERKDGWTKLQSGDLVGWAKDDYLIFDEEAEALANEVGNLIVNIETDSLRVRKSPSLDSGVYGLLKAEDELDVIEVVDENWICVDYEGKDGYVSTEYVTTEFHIDSGETMEAVKEREKKAAEEKAKLTAMQGAVMASQDETRLLGALIQCEAGNQSAEGMLAVGAVVMNRVRSSGYPNTISGVLFASGQFPPALNGNVAKVYEKGVKQSCLDAAARSIAGETNVGTATHFKRAGNHDGVVIGAHVFW